MIGTYRPSDHLALYLAEKRYEGVRERTLFGYRDSIQRFIAQCGIGEDIRELAPSHCYAWVAAMRGRGLKPGGIRSYQLNVWPWLRWLYRNGTLPVNLPELVRPVRVRDEDRLRRTVSEDAHRDLLKVAADRKEHALRNVALLQVLWGTGIRRNELAGVLLEDIDLKAGTLFIRTTKAGKPRMVGLSSGAQLALMRYVMHVRGEKPGPLFLARAGKPMSSNAIRCALKSLSLSAGVTASSHDFRRSCAAWMLRAGLEVDNVARQLGHKGIGNLSLTYGEEGRDERLLARFREIDGGRRAG